MDQTVTEARKIYDQIWNQTAQTFRTQGPRIDSLLKHPDQDLRRCVTLVARPDDRVQLKVAQFLGEAAAICPGQHLYRAEELHLTVMAVISGSETWRNEMRWFPRYREVLDDTLKVQTAFPVKFRGVTLSPDAVMIQGFPADQTLDGIRDQLRVAFRRNGFGEKLDRRYKIAAAHMTGVRFSTAGGDWAKLLDFLQANREREFGETCFRSLQLIWSNWYASAETARILQHYPLVEK